MPLPQTLALVIATFLAAPPESGPEPSDPPSTPSTPDPGKPDPAKKDALPKDVLKIPVAYPHPLITEILYAVPSGDDGDANKDGTRHATGDEFVEIFNPHDRSINLRGYSLHDKSKGKKGAMQFIFPDCTLRPKQTAVVFNGYQANITGPVGDSQREPDQPSVKFAGALVFSMKNAKENIGLANAGDAVILVAPDGTPVEIVKWGKFNEKLTECRLVDEAPPVSKCSVQRRGLTGSFSAHTDIDGLSSSPGKFEASPPAAKPEAPKAKEPAAEPKKPEKPKK